MVRKQIKKIGIVVVGAMAVIGLTNLTHPALATVPGTNQLVSNTSTGSQANGDSSQSILSANGKVVVFNSSATNILPSGGDGVFVRNIATGSIARVNVSTTGVKADSSIGEIKISATGRYVVFRSNATNLIDGTTTSASKPQLYLRDTVASTTALLSQTPASVLSNGTNTTTQGVSSDGRFVLFYSNATNLHSDAADGVSHLYMLDRSGNSLSVLDRKTDGTVSGGVWSGASMSCDGSLIAFDGASNLIVGDTYSNHVDVYLLDRRGDTNKLINLTKFAGTAVVSPSISCNGDFIGFESKAGNLDSSASVAAGYNRPYIYDRVNGSYYLAAVTTSGTSTNVDICGTVLGGTPCVQLSDTGVGVFQADDSALTGASGKQIYIRDIYSSTTELVSKNSSGVAAVGTGYTHDPTMSASGRIASYATSAANLISGDTNGRMDVFTSLTGY